MTVRVYRSTDTAAPGLDGQAGSLITLLDAVLVNGYGDKPGLGWSKPFAGTNKAAYFNGERYLRVVDDGSSAVAGSSANGTSASAIAYEAMTGIDDLSSNNSLNGVSGVDQGVYKSGGANSTGREWVVVGDEFGFYLLTRPGETVLTDKWFPHYFGKINSYKASDAYNFIVASAIPSTSPQNSMSSWVTFMSMAAVLSTLSTGISMLRNYAYGAQAKLVGFHTDYVKSGQATTMGISNSNGISNTDPVANSTYLAPVWVHENAGIVRGVMPGLWAPMGGSYFPNNDTFEGAGDLLGKTFEFFQAGSNGGSLVIETSDTWR